MKLTIDYDLFKDKLNALSSEFFAITDGKQALPILSIHQILRECEIGEYFPYRTAYFNGVRDGRATAGPQGKWIDHENHIECNKCQVWFLKDHLIRKSFCPNCGAEMMKGGAK